MSRVRFVITDRSRRLLTSIVDRAASTERFEVDDLTSEEVVEIYRLMDGLMDALWHEHADVLLQITRYQRLDK